MTAQWWNEIQQCPGHWVLVVRMESFGIGILALVLLPLRRESPQIVVKGIGSWLSFQSGVGSFWGTTEVCIRGQYCQVQFKAG
jgi:hypothetical protein